MGALEIEKACRKYEFADIWLILRRGGIRLTEKGQNINA